VIDQNQNVSNETVRVLVVDDSVVIRGLIKRFIDPEPDLEVVATAGNGELAIKRLSQMPIDVIILDIEMPVMDGLTALPKLLEASPKVKIIMASTLTLENAEISFRAMSAGAADYLPKPTSSSEIGGPGEFRRDLLEKIRAFGRIPGLPSVKSSAKPAVSVKKRHIYTEPIELRSAKLSAPPELLVIGSSTGGPEALNKVLGGISPNLGVPILIAQHMPPTFTTILAKHLENVSKWPCREAVDGDRIESGKIYLAPGDYHMVVEKRPIGKCLRLNQEPPESFCRPAVDPLLRSVAAAYKDRVLVAILTGMGGDGRKGCGNIVEAGSMVIAQDEKTSVVWGMPGAVATAGLCSAVIPIEKIASHINHLILGGAS